jgi:hypothetical protein
LAPDRFGGNGQMLAVHEVPKGIVIATTDVEKSTVVENLSATYDVYQKSPFVRI